MARRRFRYPRRWFLLTVLAFTGGAGVGDVTAIGTAAPPPAVYLIGNSLTWDTVPEALAGPDLPAANVGWHVDCGVSLPHIKAHPEKPCVESSTTWPEALASRQFDLVSVQVHYGSTLTEDADTIGFFMEQQPEATFVVHSGWAFHKARARELDHAREPAEMVHSTGYMRALLAELAKRYPGREPRQTFAQNLLAAVVEDVDAGRAAIGGVEELYRDDIHLTLDHGRYLMHNAMRRALDLPRSAAGFKDLDPRIKDYLDGVLDWLDTTSADRQALAAVLAVDAADRTAAAAKITDPRLRERVEALLPAIAAAAADLPRWQRLQAAVDAVGGKVTYGSAAPQWLLLATGDTGLDIFDVPVGVDLYDGANPLKGKGTRNEKIDDEWLANVEGVHTLRRLSLANTGVKGPGLRHVGGLENLRELSVSLTAVSDDSFPLLAGLVRLRELDMSSSQVTGTGFAHLGRLRNLERANFHYTPVNDAGLAEIAKVPVSERLWLMHTRFTDAGAAALAEQKTLRQCGFGSLDPASSGKAVAVLTGLPLEQLWLGDRQATSEGIAEAASIDTLERLEGGRPDDETLSRLARLPKLTELEVSGAAATDAGVAALATSKSLRRVKFSGGKGITAEGLETLRKHAPNLKVTGP
jgi:hypothetical protein